MVWHSFAMCFNCTFMELKFVNGQKQAEMRESFNCTFMELK